MNISEDLQMLIEAALQDGKLSSKEKEILINKAEKEGIDKDEFELYLNAQLHQKKKSEGQPNIVNKLIRFSGLGGETNTFGGIAKKGCILLIYSFVAMSVFPIIYVYLYSNSGKQKYGCSSVEDCLTKYEFEGARYFDNNGLGKSKISLAEAVFLVGNDEYERAMNVINESDVSVQELNKNKYIIVSAVIERLILKNNIDEALLWVSRICNICNIEGQTKKDVISYYGIGREGNENKKIEDYWDESKTMDKVLTEKVLKAKKLKK
jgi:hypothetical protein